MRLLLERGADVNATCNLYGGGATTLGLLLSSVHPVRAGLRIPLAEILLNAGATIDGAYGTADISEAAALGRSNVIKNFFGGLKVHPSQVQVQSAFFWACEFGRTSVADLLIRHGADVAAQNGNGMTGLHLAAIGGHLDTITLLLGRQAPLELKNVWGGTVLGNVLWAAVNHDPHADYASVVEMVIDAGAEVKPEYLPWWLEQTAPSSELKSRIEGLLRPGGGPSR
jgi:hypothetical protein